MKKKDLKIALAICPQWSTSTPSFALGSLNTALNNAGFKSTKQFDINMMSSLYLADTNPDLFRKWIEDDPWSTKKIFVGQIIPLFQDFWFKIVEELSTYDVVAFTTYSSNIMTTDFLARYLRQINPTIQIWYGGPFCWYGENGGLVEAGINQNYGGGHRSELEVSRLVAMSREFVDVGCGTNEGEKTIVELAESIVNGDGHYENVKGIWTWDKLRPSLPTVMPLGRSGRKPVYTGNLQIMKLNDLDSPTWSKEVLDGYTRIRYIDRYSNDFGPDLTVPIQGSRGCTFKCTFCSETRMYRYRSPEKIAGDISFLYNNYGVKNFWFTDSLINGSIKNYGLLIDYILEMKEKGELPEDIRYGGYFRTHKKMDTEFFDRARKSGLVYMNIGVENGVAKTLALMEKRQTPQLIRDYLDAVTKDDQITFDTGWLPGYPRETNVDFVNSLKFLYDVKHNYKLGVDHGGRINIMKGTDVLVETPLAEMKEVFGISKEESLMKNWISEDYVNNIFSRHTKAHLTDLWLKIFRINRRGLVMDVDDHIELKKDTKVKRDWKTREYQDGTMPKPQSWALDKVLYSYKNGGERKDINDEKIFNTSFLTPLSYDNALLSHLKEESFQDILENSIIDQIKGFCWVLHNIHKNINLTFDVEDNFKVFNLNDTKFYFRFDFTTNKNNDFELDLEFKIDIDEQDKEFIDIKGVDDLVVDRTYKISGNFNDYTEQSESVKELYIDSNNYTKYQINLPRTRVTGGY